MEKRFFRNKNLKFSNFLYGQLQIIFHEYSNRAKFANLDNNGAKRQDNTQITEEITNN